MYLIVAQQLVVMALIAVASFFLSRIKKFGEVECRYISALILFLVSPCVILNAFNTPFEKTKAIYFFGIVIFYLCVEIASAVIAFFCNKTKSQGLKTRSPIGNMAVVYSNLGFIGIPLVHSIFGDDGVFLLMGCNIAFNLFLWTHGLFCVTHKLSLQKIFTSPTVLAIFVGIVIFFLPFNLPQIFSRSIKLIADLNTPVGMMCLGLLFAKFDFKTLKTICDVPQTIQIAKVIFCRIIAVPSLVLLAFFLISKIFYCAGNNEILDFTQFKKIAIIILIASSCPIAINVANFATLYSPENESYGSTLVLASAILCIITVPLFVRVAEVIL